jgi:acyl dehydratase
MGTTVGNLGFQETLFPKPVFAGDTIRAETEVTAIRASRSRPGQGIVTFVHSGLNQRDEVVCRATRAALMLGRPA